VVMGAASCGQGRADQGERQGRQERRCYDAGTTR
jgi:hypothetical protein